MTPALSFVMPSRNRGDRIGSTVDTIRSQTIKDWELIVVDERSDPLDQTEDVLRSFNDARIRYYRVPLQFPTYPATRNLGNQLARADIIAVADSDDFYEPARAELTLQGFERDQCDVCYGTYEVLYEETGEYAPPKRPTPDFDLESYKERNYIPHAASAYRRTIAFDFPYNAFFVRAADYDFFFRVARYGKKFTFVPEKFFTYVVHTSNVSGGKRVREYDEILKMNYMESRGDRVATVEHILAQIESAGE